MAPPPLPPPRPPAAAPRLDARLRAAGCVYAEEEAALLTAHTSDPTELETLVRRRELGEPLEHVLGWVDFAGLRLEVAPGVFVPRQGTAALAQLAAEVVAEVVSGHKSPVVVDLCCGAGAIAAVVLARVADAEVHAADLDPAATACARANLAGAGHRASVHTGDLYDALPRSLRGRVDVLAVNAPYVPTAALALLPPEARLHEPPLALDGGDDGLSVHRRVVADAPRWLAPGGRLLIEVGEVQEAAASDLLRQAGLACVSHRDPSLEGVVVVGTAADTAGLRYLTTGIPCSGDSGVPQPDREPDPRRSQAPGVDPATAGR